MNIDTLLSSIKKNIYWYEVLVGNNGKLVERVLNSTFRDKFWRNIKNPLEVSRYQTTPET